MSTMRKNIAYTSMVIWFLGLINRESKANWVTVSISIFHHRWLQLKTRNGGINGVKNLLIPVKLIRMVMPVGMVLKLKFLDHMKYMKAHFWTTIGMESVCNSAWIISLIYFWFIEVETNSLTGNREEMEVYGSSFKDTSRFGKKTYYFSGWVKLRCLIFVAKHIVIK